MNDASLFEILEISNPKIIHIGLRATKKVLVTLTQTSKKAQHRKKALPWQTQVDRIPKSNNLNEKRGVHAASWQPSCKTTLGASR